MPWVQDSSKGLITFIGVPEFLRAIGLILPSLTGGLPWLTPLSGAGISLIMILAVIFHARRKENLAIIFNLILLALSLFCGI
ncbi:DoxX family protein [Peribacillus glennii]|uniref:DoxX family protein n=1 Tax=Peribacillus glennii TaxID=2303991 RepID=A0A372L990_9BACI|nr:DoxX family protein [Peribacillus glennii]